MDRLAARPLLLDVAAVPDEACNDCLHDLFAKAAAVPQGADIWAPHENPYVRDHVEDVTRRLQAILSAIQDAFARVLLGRAIPDLAKADVPWLRWDAVGFAEARVRLSSKPPEAYTLDDWMLIVDFIIQRYLPEGVIRTEAEYLAVRAAFAGKIQAHMSVLRPDEAGIREVAALAPVALHGIPPRVLTPMERAMIEMAVQRAALNVSSITEAVRGRMKALVVEHVAAMIYGTPAGTNQRLETELRQDFGQLNRDLRRIAVTETGEACSMGMVAAQNIGAKLRRVEAYQGACKWCRRIQGRVVTVVSPDKQDKDGDTEIWVGKTNVGRSAAPRKKVNGELVDREPEEMWWIAAGVQHPHCRGTWAPVSDRPPDVSPDFDAWLTDKIASVSSAARRDKGKDKAWGVTLEPTEAS